MRDTAALRQKVEEISYKAPEGLNRVPWIETLTLSNQINITEFKSAEDTVKIEKAMHDAAMESVKEGYRRLAAMNVPASRPTDFMAEMLRDDSTMTKVKGKLAEEAAKIKAVETRKRVQAEKKFIKKGVSIKTKAPSKKPNQATDEYTPLKNIKIGGKGKPEVRHQKKRFNNDKRQRPQKQETSFQRKEGGNKKGFKKPRKDLFKKSSGGKKGKSQRRR